MNPTYIPLAIIGLARRCIRRPREDSRDEGCYGDHPHIPSPPTLPGADPGGDNAHPAVAGASVRTSHASEDVDV